MKGAAVIRVRLLDGNGKTVDSAAKGTSDWHSLILGGRALDCESRHGLLSSGVGLPHAGHPGRQTAAVRGLFPHADGPGLRLLLQRSAVEGIDCFEPGDADRGLLTFDGPEPLSLQPGDGVLMPV